LQILVKLMVANATLSSLRLCLFQCIDMVLEALREALQGEISVLEIINLLIMLKTVGLTGAMISSDLAKSPRSGGARS
jgi:hypothetical protein